MKFFSLGSVLALSAVASAALAAPQLESRLRRDVSELVAPAAAAAAPLEYLPPGITEAALLEQQPLPVELEAEAQAEPEGYEYRTVRRLKLRHRNRRDVSHLYLPPSQAYLPPADPPAAPIDDTEEVVSAVEPKLAREYLPPAELQEETTPLPEEPEQEQPEADVRVVDVPTEGGAGQLLQDGYHYQQPAEMPAELREYLPPVQDEAVVVLEGPADGQSAVLANDGYQYRAVRRYRF
ncbi:uncharacterized protein LOC117589182 [Drosophila guanche]|uniref:DUF4794 domain-containing protein n=1 Tax=Drosophila guanche TaxID=7266 RepID=A0A3B0KKP4_DROGU|nr:uncharacterized protein LOC117589182 [Drosophila guanche]SPP87109.1 Hypothetical predicted protein [Drosophila guanche]